MKFKVKLILIIATLLMEAITCLSGYATTGMERAAKATGKMQTMEENIRQAIAQVEITGGSLKLIRTCFLTVGRYGKLSCMSRKFYHNLLWRGGI
jgi:hypothetical protein